jgi:hypothetical protein
MWIDGAAVSSPSGRTFLVVNPADGPRGQMNPRERARRLFEVARLVRERLEEFALGQRTDHGQRYSAAALALVRRETSSSGSP